jgi:hypothetical protein
LAAGVADAVQAWEDGAADAAAKLGRQVALAHKIKRLDVLERLSRIVVIENLEQGKVSLRPRQDIAREDVLWLPYISEQPRGSAKLKPEPREEPKTEGPGRRSGG